MQLKEIFGDCRILALAGDKSTGKTNNLMALIKDFRKENNFTKIYVFGLDDATLKWLKQFKDVYEISAINQLADKTDSLIIIDEFEKLKLSDRRYKEALDVFIDFIYHNNNWIIFSSPNLREFNSVIGGKIERWLLKSMRISSLVNGSQLKKAVEGYSGRFKVLGGINISPDKLIVINDDREIVKELPYIEAIDNKVVNVDIFNCQEKSQGKGQENCQKR